MLGEKVLYSLSVSNGARHLEGLHSDKTVQNNRKQLKIHKVIHEMWITL